LLAGPKLLLTLTADLSSIPTDQMSTGAGRDGEMYYICSFEIRIKFHSAHTTYSLWYEGKCYGAAEAEYA
jgi:YHS domain-containing protein